MQQSLQLSLIELAEAPSEDWTFRDAPTRELTHCYHDYPARMIPQVAGKLLDLFGRNARLLFDPYCGSGTSLVESNLRGIHAIGTDLNPLARLIAQTKTSLPNLQRLETLIQSFNRFALESKLRTLKDAPPIRGIPNLEFWFKPDVIEKLYQVRHFVTQIDDEKTRQFFQIAFSETVRESSNTRNSEFKLYRYPPEKLAQFNPDVYGIMTAKLQRNLSGYHKYSAIIQNLAHPPSAAVYNFNTVDGIPLEVLQPESIDLVVTSPPYGDSGTTVAYGQYSRLSAAWLELEEPDKIDRKLMGAKTAQNIPELPCDDLQHAILKIAQRDEKRARHVAAFYIDLLASIANVAMTIKPQGYACYVVGNRKVKGVTLPTDIAVKNFFEQYGFVYVDTFVRDIPNKRMPAKNSPSNVRGDLENTMAHEYIVVLQKI